MSRRPLLIPAAGGCARPSRVAESATQRLETPAVGEGQGSTAAGVAVRVDYRTMSRAQGSPPRLAPSGKDGDGFAFDQVDAAHLQDGASRLHRLALSPTDGGPQREETRRAAGGDESSRLRPRRLAAAA